ncbi:MAG: hypothetical protein ABSH04_08110, partial [Acidimicrobiales bacterium]
AGEKQAVTLAGSGARSIGASPAWLGVIVRVASHVMIWTVVVVPVVSQLAHGWRALFDDATTSTRAFEVFSTHSSLLGPYSTASSTASHTVYGLGPLMFWLLALPVHLSAQGALWGAAFWCGVVFSLAIEAAWSRKGWTCGMVVALGVVDLAWQAPDMFGHSAWNPYFGESFFLASVVFAWVVASGGLRWWPVLVFSASVAAQCHLIFAVAAVALALLAPVLGVLRERRVGRWRWFEVGLAVGVVCWVPTLVQQATGRPGNVTALLQVGHGQARQGLSVGLRFLGAAGSQHPIWLRHFDAGSFWSLTRLESSHSPAYGIFVLCLVGSIGVVAQLAGRRDLADLSVVGVACLLGTLITIASVPSSGYLNLSYLVVCLWIPGLVVWIVVAWAAAEVARVGLGQVRRGGAAHLRDAARRWDVAAGVVGVALVLAVGLYGCVGLATSSTSQIQWAEVGVIGPASKAVEHAVPRGPLELTVVTDAGASATYGEAQGVAWQLTADGRSVGEAFLPAPSGLSVPAHARWPVVTVVVRRSRVVSVSAKR